MSARKLKRPKSPEYGTCCPNAPTRRTMRLKRRIASATRSRGEVFLNHTRKRREEIGDKFRVPGGQYNVASRSWRPETADAASAVAPTSFKFCVPVNMRPYFVDCTRSPEKCPRQRSVRGERASLRAMILTIPSLVTALIAGVPFAVAARSLSSFRLYPPLDVSRTVHSSLQDVGT